MDTPKIIEDLDAAQRRLLLRVLLRITIYYALVAALIAIAVAVNPRIVEGFPLGGVGEIAYYGSSSVLELEDAFLSADDEELEGIITETQRAQLERAPAWYRGAVALFYAMFSTLLLMLPVSWVYKAIHTDSVYDHSIDPTTLVLPAVVAGIVTVVQHSLALAFSLAGIAAGVRFRRALSDTFDTLFILASIGVGIAAGIKSIEIAVVLTVFFNYATLLVCTFGDGLESQYEVRRKLEKRAGKELRADDQKAKADRTGPMSSL
jgi:vacuolar-type H+-ATPase subunit F/Vma7